MAFMIDISGKRPSIWILFKWVALIFWLPLITIAAAATIVTLIAQLPELGQLVFAGIFGVLTGGIATALYLPRVLSRRDMQTSYPQISTISVALGLLFVAIKVVLHIGMPGGIPGIVAAMVVGVAVMPIVFALGYEVDHLVKAKYERHMRHKSHRQAKYKPERKKS
jgi:hypothetical protein